MVEKKIFPSRDFWLEARNGTIGGSDAACIVGLNPYKTNQMFYDEFISAIVPDDISKKDCIVYGNEVEPLIRGLFAADYKNYDVFYEENNMFLNSEYPFAHASLDGWISDNGEKGVLEIKTTEIKGYQQSLKWKDCVPSNYYVQVCFYMAVTESSFAVLRALQKHADYSIIKDYLFEYEDCKKDCDYIMECCKKFVNYNVAKGVRPDLILPGI